MEHVGTGGLARGWARKAGRLGALAALAALTALAACGGGGDDAAPKGAASATATVDGDGGRIVSPAAEVVIPPRALDAQTTIRIAASSGGSPAFPGWIVPAGDMLELTPHGATFSEPVTVRLKAPAVPVAANERLLIAKAQPGGSWTVLADTTLRDGMLEAKVDSLSYFVPVRVRFQPTALVVEPFTLAPMALDCGGQPCGWRETLRDITITATTTGNGGVFPAGCENPEIEFTIGYLDQPSQTLPIGARIPATASGVAQRSFPMLRNNWGPFYRQVANRQVAITASLICNDPTLLTPSKMRLSASGFYVDFPSSQPSTAVVHQFPTTLELAVGEAGRIAAVLSGGGNRLVGWDDSGQPNYQFVLLGPTSGVFVELQRRAPGATAWEVVFNRDQMAMDLSPTGAPRGMYWGFDHPVIASATLADNGTLYRVRVCNELVPPGACIVSAPALVVVTPVGELPQFTRQPAGALITAGQTASFTVTAAGVPAPTLKWQTRPPGATGAWTDIAGATATSHTTAAMQAADNGRQFRVLATNTAGSTASDPAIVSVTGDAVAPAIIAQPQSLTVIAGSQALFAVGASGTAALSYQWSKNGTPITGANGPQLLIAGAQAADAGAYRVVVSNTAGSATSNAVTLAVDPSGIVPDTAPGIVTQPAAVAVTEGNVATFAVGVTGSSPMSFQWRRNGVPIAGATRAAFTIPAVAGSDAGSYDVAVVNPAGSIVSQPATLAVSPAASAASPPTIVQQPGGLVVVPGFDAAIGVTATGSGPLVYRWFRNNVELPGPLGAVLTITAAGSGDGGSYRVEVGNALGTATSSTVQVTLVGAPAITQQPAAASGTVGATATFGVIATGDALRYQWLRNGTVVPGATGASHTTASLLQADSGAVYSVVVFNGAGAQVSAPALLTVTPPAATGTLLAHEGFSYTLGENLAGKSGGSGWSGAWTATDGYLSPLAASASGTIVAGLGYTDSGGRRLLASGGAWSSSAGVFFGQIQRASVDKPGAAGSTRWLSMIVRQDAPPAGINYVMAAPGRGWSFGSSATAMAAGIGGTGVFVNCWYCSGTPATAPIAGWTQGSTALLLVRVDFAVSGNDTVSLWINPTLDPAVDIGAPTATASLSNFAELLDGVTVGWGDFRSFTVDELRIGTGRTAVLPIATP